jgi:hypothetical protein
MIVRFRRTLDPATFAEKYPMPHVIVGHYNPHEQIDEEGTGQPSYFTVLGTAQNALSLVGECSGFVDMGTATIKLSYAVAEDAARVRELVSATPDESLGHCASMAFFNYDRPLYDKLRAIRDERIGAIGAALERGEDVKHVTGTGEPTDDSTEREAHSMVSHEGHERSSTRVVARIPLKQVGQR